MRCSAVKPFHFSSVSFSLIAFSGSPSSLRPHKFTEFWGPAGPQPRWHGLFRMPTATSEPCTELYGPSEARGKATRLILGAQERSRKAVREPESHETAHLPAI